MKAISFFVVFAAILVFATPSFADDAGINAIYERMSAAYAQGDPEGLRDVYAPDTIYFLSTPETEPLMGADRVVAHLGGMLTGLKQQGATSDLKFRVTHRRTMGDVAIDTGLYRLEIRGADGKSSVHVGKFLVTATRQPDGRWAFMTDTDTPMKADAWDRAVPAAGAVFAG